MAFEDGCSATRLFVGSRGWNPALLGVRVSTARLNPLSRIFFGGATSRPGHVAEDWSRACRGPSTSGFLQFSWSQ